MINKRDKVIDRMIKKYMGKTFYDGYKWYQIVGFSNSYEYPILVKILIGSSTFFKFKKDDKLIIKPNDGIMNPSRYTSYAYQLFCMFNFY